MGKGKKRAGIWRGRGGENAREKCHLSTGTQSLKIEQGTEKKSAQCKKGCGEESETENEKKTPAGQKKKERAKKKRKNQ